MLLFCLHSAYTFQPTVCVYLLSIQYANKIEMTNNICAYIYWHEMVHYYVESYSFWLSWILSMDFHLLAIRGRFSITLTTQYATQTVTSLRTTVPIIHCTDYTHTAPSNQTHFISPGLPLSDCQVMFWIYHSPSGSRFKVQGSSGSCFMEPFRVSRVKD